jgi:hypothetical protein
MGIGSGNIAHYFNNHNHIANPYFSQSLPAIQKALVMEGDHAVKLVTAPQNVPFYSILKREYTYLTVTTELPQTAEVPTLVLPEVGKTINAIPSRIVTSERANNAVTLRIYRQQ